VSRALGGQIGGVFEIRQARPLAPLVKRFRIAAPRVARYWRPGQFVIVRVSTTGERIPLTIVDGADDWIDLIVQAVGKTTDELLRLEAGDSLADVAGPLGVPSVVERVGEVTVVGGGVGTAIAFPIARAFHQAGNQVTAIIGGRTREHVLLEEELGEVCREVRPATNDGSYGHHGLVTDVLAEMLTNGPLPDLVVAAGPIPMMRAVAETTRPHRVKTVVSLNPIMVDGTGMCGGCRVLVGGKTRFACVDGPEFDAHDVDFDILAARNLTYRQFEIERRCEVMAP
jgi:ferredoxin--NADP+ reductase